VHEAASDAAETERAVFGRGFTNGLVVIARRLMATGLEPGDDPKKFEGD
jgi:HTH-type transcriptional regulator, sugar sensing transcriptional regulator